ncbi:hypothetical protein Ancab_026687 [Ancistrocladus abbreviatus]
MGGLLHLLDFNQGNTARKHKKQGGLEAPRNSLELQAETFQSNCAVEDYAAYSYEAKHDLSKMKSYSTDASMKKLTKEEISKKSNKMQNAPSIVARLMGMDVLSSDAKLEVQPADSRNEKTGTYGLKAKTTEKLSAGRVQKPSKSSSNKGLRPDQNYGAIYSDNWSKGTNFKNPQPRVHPQEKELQRFKKEFEAWQAARFLECARVVELGNIPEQWLAQLDLTKEKMTIYGDSRNAVIENSRDLKSDAVRSRSLNRGGLQYGRCKEKLCPPQHEDPYSFKNKGIGKQFEQLSLMDSDKKPDKYSAPTRIVILKPGPDSFSSNDESWVSSSGSVEDRDSIEDLLEEVKERLKCEMHGKTFKKGSMVRGGGIETPFKEKPLNSKQMARHIAQQVGEDVTQGSSVNMLSSESTRSYRREIQTNEPQSPEFNSGDATIFLSERLRNVLNVDNRQNIQNSSPSICSPPMFDNVREQLEQARNILNAENGRNCWNGINYGVQAQAQAQAQARSFRCRSGDEGIFQDEFSPRNLVRSLSAPVSGTSFGKLLLEDRHVLTGAHIRRKHETLESISKDGKSRKKDRFNFREKVSNIRYSLTLKRRLFSRKFQSVDASQGNEFDLMNDCMGGPTPMTNYGDQHSQENSTEVPPSPASVCSSAQEEIWKVVDHPSPLSTSDMTSVGDQSVGHVFREISSNLDELRRQLNQLDHDGSEVTTVAEEPSEFEVVDLEDEAEAYIRDLLVASGLYASSSDKLFSRWDPFVKPISNWVFQKVEESFEKLDDKKDAASKGQSERNVQHRLLFDLLNEALSTVLGPPVTSFVFRKRITASTSLPLPRGRKLLEKVWEIIREHLYPLSDKAFYSLEDIVAQDMDLTPWSGLIDNEVKVLGREFECQIIRELVEEVVKDMQK